MYCDNPRTLVELLSVISRYIQAVIGDELQHVFDDFEDLLDIYRSYGLSWICTPCMTAFENRAYV